MQKALAKRSEIMETGDKVVLSAIGTGLNKNKLMTSGGVWEGTVREIRGDEYRVYWVLVSGRSNSGSLITEVLEKHSRNEIKYA